jgi:hypothetical protein
LNDDFNSVRSDILGGLLALVQGYLRDGIPRKGEASEFRMTTYASVGRYVALSLGTHLDFARAYRTNQLGMSRNSLEAEPITDFILWYVDKYGGKCTGCTPSEGWGVEKKLLFDKFFNDWISDKQIFGDKKLPRMAGKLLSKMKRIAPDLLKIYKIEIKNMGIHKGKDWVMIRRVTKDDHAPVEREIDVVCEEDYVETHGGITYLETESEEEGPRITEQSKIEGKEW